MWFTGDRSRPKPAGPASGDAAAASEKLQHWGDSSQEVSVLEKEAGNRVVQVRAKVKLHPTEVYQLLIHPDNWKVFKSQMPATKRAVVADTGVQQTVEIEQQGRWKFLCFKGTFPVKLRIVQNSKSKTVSFELMERRSFMKKFDGEWRISDFSATALAETAGLDGQAEPGKNAAAEAAKRRVSNALSDFRQKTGVLRTDRDRVALVTMRQSLELAITPPPGVSHLVSKIAGSVMSQTLSDMQKEANNIRNGKATLIAQK